MKIIITESQLKLTLIKEFLKKKFPQFISDVEIEDKTINIKLKGESNIKTEGELAKEIKKDLKIFFSVDYKINVSFESEYSIDIEFYKLDKNRYKFYLTKEMENGETFEMDGELFPYHTGKDTEYEVEPNEYSDEEYYSNHWEDIDKVVIDKFYEVKNDL